MPLRVRVAAHSRCAPSETWLSLAQRGLYAASCRRDSPFIAPRPAFTDLSVRNGLSSREFFSLKARYHLLQSSQVLSIQRTKRQRSRFRDISASPRLGEHKNSRLQRYQGATKRLDADDASAFTRRESSIHTHSHKMDTMLGYEPLGNERLIVLDCRYDEAIQTVLFSIRFRDGCDSRSSYSRRASCSIWSMAVST